MSKQDSNDSTGMIVAGVTGFALGLVGIGLFRRGKPPANSTASNVVEDSAYRGFKYRIENCALGSTPAFLAIVPIQTVGTVSITADEGDLLATIDEARKQAQKVIDAKLGLRLQAVFVGAGR